jgi:hypothetical protein
MKILFAKNDGSILLMDPDPEQAISNEMEIAEVADSARALFGQSAHYQWDGKQIVVTPINNPPDESTLAINDFRSNYDVADQRLGDIVANIGTYTNAQLRDSIGDIARILRRLLHLGRALNG